MRLDRNWSDLELHGVRERIYEKYQISRSDAQLAVDYLACFFDAKRAHPEQLLILPQIADWAWHELILDTRRYRNLCGKIFGKFLHHRADAISDDEESQSPTSKQLRASFTRSLALMNDSYGLGLGDNPRDWLDAGWDKPKYRLRNAVSPSFYKSPVNYDLPVVRFLSWLPGRLERRFGFDPQEAKIAVREYSDVFCSGLIRHSATMSNAAHIAWEEHILWTARYEEDSMKMIGTIVDHELRDLAYSQ